jgi:hypothetical protein
VLAASPAPTLGDASTPVATTPISLSTAAAAVDGSAGELDQWQVDMQVCFYSIMS